MTKLRISSLALAGLLVFSPCAHAGTFDALYVFGDSLSDAGNVFAATGIPGPPYYNGQFSNGPVAPVDLAADLGLGPLLPSLLGGTDYAYGTGESGPTSFNTSNPQTDFVGPTGQLAQFQATHPTADPNALYLIFLGANDLSDIPAASTPAQIGADIGAIVGNIDFGINTLAAEGAKDFLIVTVPDLGKTPAAIAGGAAVSAGASALSAAFDSTLVNGGGGLPSLSTIAGADHLSLNVLDTYSLLDGIDANPSAYGFTNVTTPCLVGATVCSNPNQDLFFDTQHPTAAGQTIIANAEAAVLPTPEPASITLVGAGLLGLIVISRRVKTMTLAKTSGR